MTVKNFHFFTGFEVRQTLWACRWASLADSINVSSQRGLDRAENWRSDGGRELTLFLKRHQTIQQIKCLQGVRWSQAMIPTCLCEIQFIKPPSPSPGSTETRPTGCSPLPFLRCLCQLCCADSPLIAAHHFWEPLKEERNRFPVWTLWPVCWPSQSTLIVTFCTDQNNV